MSLFKERDDLYESLTYSTELYGCARLIWKTGTDMQEKTRIYWKHFSKEFHISPLDEKFIKVPVAYLVLNF